MEYSSSYDMNDSLEDLQKYRLIKDILYSLDSIINPSYTIENNAAILDRKIYTFFAIVAIITGTVAIFASLIVLSGTFGEVWPHRIEVLAAGTSLVIVLVGLWIKFHDKWLIHRFKAESFRLLKFQALINHPSLWCESLEEVEGNNQGKKIIGTWEREQFNEVDSIKTKKDLESFQIAISDATREFVPYNFQCEEAKTRALVEYYLDKRIGVQKKYYENQSEKRERYDKFLHLIPLCLFFGGVLMAFIHFIFNNIPFFSTLASFHTINKLLVFLAVGLPIIGLAIRTYRLSKEYRRSALIFRARLHKLEQLGSMLQTEMEQPLIYGIEISSLLIQCEHLFEEEQHEWMRLMMDIEWFL